MDLKLNPLTSDIWLRMLDCPGWPGPPEPFPSLHLSAAASLGITRPWQVIEIAVRIWAKRQAEHQMSWPDEFEVFCA